MLLDRYLTEKLSPPKPAESYIPVAEFNRDFVSKFEAVEGMRLEELKDFLSALMDLRAKVGERVEK